MLTDDLACLHSFGIGASTSDGKMRVFFFVLILALFAALSAQASASCNNLLDEAEIDCEAAASTQKDAEANHRVFKDCVTKEFSKAGLAEGRDYSFVSGSDGYPEIRCPEEVSQTPPVIVATTFCNRIDRDLYVVIAYPVDDGSWMARGWLKVNPGTCAPFDSALRPRPYYIRAETDYYPDASGRSQRQVWGDNGDKAFDIRTTSFNFWAANVAEKEYDKDEVRKNFAPLAKDYQFMNGKSYQVTVDFTSEGIDSRVQEVASHSN